MSKQSAEKYTIISLVFESSEFKDKKFEICQSQGEQIIAAFKAEKQLESLPSVEQLFDFLQDPAIRKKLHEGVGPVGPIPAKPIFALKRRIGKNLNQTENNPAKSLPTVIRALQRQHPEWTMDELKFYCQKNKEVFESLNCTKDSINSSISRFFNKEGVKARKYKTILSSLQRGKVTVLPKDNQNILGPRQSSLEDTKQPQKQIQVGKDPQVENPIPQQEIKGRFLKNKIKNAARFNKVLEEEAAKDLIDNFSLHNANYFQSMLAAGAIDQPICPIKGYYSLDASNCSYPGASNFSIRILFEPFKKLMNTVESDIMENNRFNNN